MASLDEACNHVLGAHGDAIGWSCVRRILQVRGPTGHQSGAGLDPRPATAPPVAHRPRSWRRRASRELDAAFGRAGRCVVSRSRSCSRRRSCSCPLSSTILGLLSGFMPFSRCARPTALARPEPRTAGRSTTSRGASCCRGVPATPRRTTSNHPGMPQFRRPTRSPPSQRPAGP